MRRRIQINVEAKAKTRARLVWLARQSGQTQAQVLERLILGARIRTVVGQ